LAKVPAQRALVLFVELKKFIEKWSVALEEHEPFEDSQSHLRLAKT